MDKVIHCDCGFDVCAEHEVGLVAEVQRHAREAHGMALSDDEALLLVFRAGLDAEAPARELATDVVLDPSQELVSERDQEER